jgi:hypothetical protein
MNVCTTHLILLVLGAHYLRQNSARAGGGCLSLLVGGFNEITCSSISIALFAAGVSNRL